MRGHDLAFVALAIAIAVPSLAATQSAPQSPSPSETPVVTIEAGATDVPAPAPSATPTATPTATALATSPRKADRDRPTATPSAIPTPTPVPAPSATPTASPSPTFHPIVYGGATFPAKPGYGLPGPKPSPGRFNLPGFPATARPTEPAQVDSPPPGDLTEHDRSMLLVGATWSCTTFEGTKLAHRVVRDASGVSFKVSTAFDLPGKRTGQTSETYTYHRRTHLWEAKIEGGAIVATAPPWVGNTWTFVGTSTDRQKASTPFRMIYSYLDDNAYRRDFERTDEVGAWFVFAGETCRRRPDEN